MILYNIPFCSVSPNCTFKLPSPLKYVWFDSPPTPPHPAPPTPQHRPVHHPEHQRAPSAPACHLQAQDTERTRWVYLSASSLRDRWGAEVRNNLLAGNSPMSEEEIQKKKSHIVLISPAGCLCFVENTSCVGQRWSLQNSWINTTAHFSCCVFDLMLCSSGGVKLDGKNPPSLLLH